MTLCLILVAVAVPLAAVAIWRIWRELQAAFAEGDGEQI